MTKPTRLDYCQYLLSTPINYTLTHFADHCEAFSHDQIKPLSRRQSPPPAVCLGKRQIAFRAGHPMDTFSLMTPFWKNAMAKEIAIAHRQYSGNAGGIINGIGIVTCVYVNPELDRFWVIDYRIYDPRGDGKNQVRACSRDALGIR